MERKVRRAVTFQQKLETVQVHAFNFYEEKLFTFLFYSFNLWV